MIADIAFRREGKKNKNLKGFSVVKKMVRDRTEEMSWIFII